MKERKIYKKIITVLLAMAVIISFNTVYFRAFAYNVTADVRTIYDIPSDLTGKTVILHSNDVHGAIGRYAYIASVKQNLEDRGADVVLVDCGDFSQGEPYVSTTKGLDAISAMNAAGYDIATLGNHEFDYGYTQLRANLAVAKFKTICADVYDASGNPILDPNTVYTTKSGLKLGFFGMETPETKTKANPVHVQGLRFLAGGELYTCAQQQIEELRGEGSDLIICLAHLGVDDVSAVDGQRSVDLYANTSGIDIMLDGHSHTVMTSGENNVPIQSTGTKLQTIGLVMIDDASKTIEDHYLISLDGLQKEVISDAVATAIIKRVDKEYGTVFAKSEVDLNGERESVRTEETNMGNLITDAMRYEILKNEGTLSVDSSNVVVLVNGGSIRASIGAGDVTKKSVNTVLPFQNTLEVIYVTGAELLEALEASTYCLPASDGCYPQTAGIKFTVNATRAYSAASLYPESTFYKPASIQRVHIESINGLPFSSDEIYAVITNNFVAAGGDSYYAFGSASSKYDTGIMMDEVLMDYVQNELHGVIPASKYANTRGDQTVIK